MRIAIVDDLAGERALLRGRLERALNRRSVQADFSEFESGSAFLAAAKAEPFAAAFLDIYMPGIDGVETARALRAFDSACLLVFTTTSTDHALEGFASICRLCDTRLCNVSTRHRRNTRPPRRYRLLKLCSS